MFSIKRACADNTKTPFGFKNDICIPHNAYVYAMLHMRTIQTVIFARVYSARKCMNMSTKDVINIELVHTIQTLLHLGKRVIVVYPVPRAGFHVPRTGHANWIKGTHVQLTIPFDKYSKAYKDIIDALNDIKHVNLTRIQPHKLLCNTTLNQCFTHSDTDYFYQDAHHLSAQGTKLVVREIVKFL